MNQAQNTNEDVVVAVQVQIGVITKDGRVVPMAPADFLVNIKNTHADPQMRAFAALFLSYLPATAPELSPPEPSGNH